jgi:hypothetical protein
MWNSARRTENRHSDHVARITPRGASDERRAIRQCRECTQAAAFLLRCCFSQRIRTATNGSIAHEIECRTVQLLILTTGRGRPSPKTPARRGLKLCVARPVKHEQAFRHQVIGTDRVMQGNDSTPGGTPPRSLRESIRPSAIETNPVVTFGMFLNRITVNPETILSFHLDAAARANA